MRGIAIASTLALSTTLFLAAPAAVHGEPPQPALTAPGHCRGLIDDTGKALPVVVTWTERREEGQRRQLDRQCETVGPMVLRADPGEPSSTGNARGTLAVVGWNVHVGGGDIEEFLDQLTAGTLTDGPASHYVLLLEEAYRSGAQVPPRVPDGVRVPRRIAPTTKGRTREDIVSLARRRQLALYYVPSMRNGAGPPYEDRGNAILSTLPLSDLTAIELPFARQRRVAISATVRGTDAQNRPWRLRLVTVHLDALASASRLWIFAAGWRGRQAHAVVEALDQAEPSVLGGDLNTWLAGRWECAYRRIARVFPPPRAASRTGVTEAHGWLDYVFFRLRPDWTRTSRRLRSDFESDHRPIVATLHLSP